MENINIPSYKEVVEFSKKIKPKCWLPPDYFWRWCDEHNWKTKAGPIEDWKKFYQAWNWKICYDKGRPRSLKEVVEFAKTVEYCFVDPKTFFYWNDKRGWTDLEDGKKSWKDLFMEWNTTAQKRGIDYTRSVAREAVDATRGGVKNLDGKTTAAAR